MLMKDPH